MTKLLSGWHLLVPILIIGEFSTCQGISLSGLKNTCCLGGEYTSLSSEDVREHEHVSDAKSKELEQFLDRMFEKLNQANDWQSFQDLCGEIADKMRAEGKSPDEADEIRRPELWARIIRLFGFDKNKIANAALDVLYAGAKRLLELKNELELGSKPSQIKEELLKVYERILKSHNEIRHSTLDTYNYKAGYLPGLLLRYADVQSSSFKNHQHSRA
eukprot:Lankesteria_metandrocarpae@DN2942_c0_g1_i3.p1